MKTETVSTFRPVAKSKSYLGAFLSSAFHFHTFAFALIMSLLLSLVSLSPVQAVTAEDLNKLELPKGFKISIYSDQVPGARQMALSPEGTLYVGTIAQNTVYALPDRDKDGKPDKVVVVATDLKRPNGVCFRKGALYVGELGKISRYENIETALDDPKKRARLKPIVVNNNLPTREWHGYKYIRFGPDGLLYVPVGAPCNVGIQEDPRFATIMRMNASGKNAHVYASGIRNTVGYDWHPETKELWFTDNGRDYLGDNLPPDELNRAPKRGMHFGFPYRYGMNVPDPEFGYIETKLEFTAPAVPLGPHVASLGMRFYTGEQFPREYRGSIFICEHGSWNRTKKIGYRISRVSFDKNGKPDGYEVFCQGFREDESFWGRPVDLCLMPDGSLLVSDDAAGAIYRISYEK